MGEMDVLDDCFTATVIHPQASLKQVKESLRLVLRDIDLRIEKEKNNMLSVPDQPAEPQLSLSQ